MASPSTSRAHEHVKRLLRQRVGSVWPPGTQLPPIRQLAEQLGTGQNSTQRAVRDLVKEGWLESSPRRGTVVRSPASARTTAAQAGPLFGCHVRVFRTLADAFVLAAEASLRDELTALGAQMTVHESLNGTHPDAPLNAEPGQPVIFVNQDRSGPLPKGRPVVLIDTAVEHTAPADSSVDIVTVDSYQGGFLAGAHMRDIGCKAVSFLGVWHRERRDVPDPSCAARLAGFEAGWGYPINHKHDLRCTNFVTSQGAARVPDWLAMNPRPAGIFAASDDMAVGFVHGARAHGLEAGVDYQIIGFDGQVRGRELDGRSLTTIEVPMSEMGRHAAMLLTDRIQHPHVPARRVTLSTTLFPGNTAVRQLVK